MCNTGSSRYEVSASYDAAVRLSSLSVTNASTSAVLFSSQRGYDAASNVTAVNTTLSAGTDNQAFCYDEQNRLVWAGANGAPSCGGTLTAGTLTSAAYTQAFAYDTLDRLTSGPLGTYTYGDSAHLHAVTSIGTNSYTATYDASGDMTCRAPNNTTTCAGTQTGAQLGYDNEGRLATWQNAPTSPTTSDSFLYDGAGNRVEQSVTVNGSITTTTTYVAGGLEEISANGVGTTLTKYFTGASGLPTAERVGTNGPLSYLASDGQGTVSEALDSGGTVTFAQLYTPYGNARYSSGSSPTSIGYTGQRADSATGLDYYQARYYDPVAGQFASADTVADGLNRYGYVAGNPTTATDPSGHRLYGGGSEGSGAGNDAIKYWEDRGQQNLRKDYDDDWGWYQVFGNGSKFDNRDPQPAKPEELKDGDVLAAYFQLYVVRDPRAEKNKQTEYDYRVVESWQHAPCFCVFNPLLPDNENMSTKVDLYKPIASTPDWNEDSRYGGGWVQEAKSKGKQAPIVVVDLDNVDPDGKMSNVKLTSYATDIIFWRKQGSASHVARVIFMRENKVVWDVDPFGYGPPGRPNG